MYYKWKKAFLDGGLNALRDNGKTNSQEATLKKENEELKAQIGDLTVENRFLKNTRVIRDYKVIETVRKEEQISIRKACRILEFPNIFLYNKQIMGMRGVYWEEL